MPEISRFFGIAIQMFGTDHATPHFHATYAGQRCSIDLRTLEVIRGTLPRRAMALTLEWAALHRGALMEDWQLCVTGQPPRKIPPLV